METALKNIINSFDSVFAQLGQRPLLENPNFQIDNDSFEFYFEFKSVEKEGRIKMMFEISSDGVTFYLDRTAEIPEWSGKSFKMHKVEIEKELKQLFESEVLVEYKGSRTRIILLDRNGSELRRFTFWDGLSINWFKPVTNKSFSPFF